MRRRGFLLGLLASTASVPVVAAAPSPLLTLLTPPDRPWLTLSEFALSPSNPYADEIARLLCETNDMLGDMPWETGNVRVRVPLQGWRTVYTSRGI